MTKKISFAAITVMITFAFVSCSVEYKARHPNHKRHNKVIVVGQVLPAKGVDTVNADITQQDPLSKTYGIGHSKSQ